ncbi:hypothetical protein ACJRO7_001318 [Eucalyptus globulus]|uniref:Threonine dehydratase n=1 Tax=Eucalyptus globulus TaxID=34317 RepID=A0ABD3LQJ7_EUCGL
MEALQLAQPQPLLLRSRRACVAVAHTLSASSMGQPRRPLVRATLSKQTAERSPLLSPCGNPSQASTSAPPSSQQPLPRVSASSLQYPPGYLGAVHDRSAAEGAGDSIINAMSHLTNILSSKVYDVAKETPLQLATKLSERWGVNVWLKREDLQPVFSFKLRGAYNMMAKLTREQLENGVICSSSGNHAQGVAFAAKKLNCSAVIAMPVTTSEIKWRSVERLGGTVVLAGNSYDEAQAYAKKRGDEEERTFIPPFDHPDVIMGQGTIGMEIVRHMQGPLHAIFVPVGGGGLVAGIAAYIKRVSPEVKIIGVQPADANAMALSLHHGQRIMLDQVGGFADGVAVKVVGEETFRLCKELVDGIILVSRGAICTSIKDMFEEKRNILEPAGALALAGAEAYCKYYGLKGENVVAITSGANMNFDKLSMVTELANVGPMNVREFIYGRNSDEQTVVPYKDTHLTLMEIYTHFYLDHVIKSHLRQWIKSTIHGKWQRFKYHYIGTSFIPSSISNLSFCLNDIHGLWPLLAFLLSQLRLRHLLPLIRPLLSYHYSAITHFYTDSHKNF